MKEKTPRTEASISCTVSQGLFSSERGVFVELPDGRKVTAFVDKRDVIIDRDPARGEKVRGRVKVAVVEEKKDFVIVDLPQPTITGGPRLRVPKVFLD
jgi:putative intracellular protease/amidase